MKDESKTKKQLIEELNMLRKELISFSPSEINQKNKKQYFGKPDEIFPAILHNSPIAIVIARLADRKIVEASDSFLLSTGYTREEVIGHTAVELHLIEQEYFLHLSSKLNADKSVHNVEISFRRKDGKIGHGLFSAVIVNISGAPHLLTEIIDVTEKKKAEEEQRKHSAEISDLYDNAPCGYHSLADDGTFLKINDTELSWLGYDREEIVGRKKLIDLLSAESVKIFLQTFPVLKKQGRMNNLELEMVRKDKTILSVLLNATAVTDAAGNFIMSRSTIFDNTERKKAQDALMESEEKFNKAFFNSPLMMMITSLNDGHIIDVSNSFLNVSGYQRHEVVGKNVAKLHLYDDYEQRNYVLEQVRKQGYLNNFEVLTRDKQGRIHYTETFFQLIDLKGEKCLLAVLNDITQKKQIESELQEKTDELEQFFACNLDMFCIADTDGYFRRVNGEWENVLGYQLDQLEGQRFLDFVHPDDIKDTFRAIANLGNQIKVQNFINRYRHKDGSYRIIEWRAFPQGKIIYASARDITERIKAEDTVRQSEERFRKVFEEGSFGMILADYSANFIKVNAFFCKMLGYTEAELTKISFKDITHPDDILKDAKNVKIVFSGELPVYKTEKRYLRKNGEIIWGALTLSAVRNFDGAFLHYLGMIEDITERKKMEEVLRANEQRYRNIFENAVMGIFQSTPDGHFIHVNPALARMCGYDSPADMISSITNIANQYLVYPEERTKALQIVEEKGFIDNYEYQVYRKDGKKIWLQLNARCIRDKNNKTIYYEGTYQDVTSQRQAEDERRSLEDHLRRSEKMEALGKLAGGVAHDLNNILGVLVGYSELLLMEISELHPLRRHVNNILQSGERAAAIIQDLLTLARRGVAVSEVINLNSIVSDYLKTPEFEALQSAHQQVHFKTILENNLLNFKGSPVHINKSLMNLITNAAESLTGSGEVIITTENVYLDKPFHGFDETKPGEYVVLKISDTGKGIAAKDISRIFEPFYTKKIMGRSGTGLGLAVVWGTVKDHNGCIDVQSTEGKGSTFTMYFPATREKQAGPDQHVSPASYSGKGESILVVDDIPEQRELATQMLQKIGYRVKSVSSGEEAVEYVRKNNVDLIVLDMIMEPGIDGLETYQRIRTVKPGQKAIIVSGFSENDRVANARALGAGAYVRKPYIMEKIGLAIRQELDKK